MPSARARIPDRSALARSCTAIVSASLLATIGLGACGTPETPPPAKPASAAAARPDPRPTAAPLLTDVINRVTEHGSVRTTVRGDLGFIGDLEGQGSARYNGEHADVSLRGSTRPSPAQPPQALDLTILDGVGYVKSALLRPEPAKPWLRIAPDGTGFAAKLLAPALRQLQDSTDPRATFQGIESATKIQSSAPDQLDGKPATRYSLRVLTAAAAAKAPDDQQRRRLQQAADNGRPEIGYELWIGKDGLPMRFAAAQKVAQAGQVSLQSDYRDWGAPVEITPPPPEQVGEFPGGPLPMAQPPR